MDIQLLVTNLTNPTLLFFLLGIIAVRLKSDLEIPASSAKFISLYLLFSIGFKGGQELQHSTFSYEILWCCLAGILISALIPIYTFFLVRTRFSVANAAAIAAAYGSVSAVTFVAAAGFLEAQGKVFSGHMVAVMALMEFPAIIAGVMLYRIYISNSSSTSIRKVVHHAFTNGSVLMITGSLVIGLLSDAKAAESIRPFTTDIFKGFLALFLLEMGLTVGNRLSSFMKHGWFAIVIGIMIPCINGCIVAIASQVVTTDPSNRFIFAVLAASASYIAVPAAMRLAAPQADEGLYIPMALGVTFPFNITLGMPLYQYCITM